MNRDLQQRINKAIEEHNRFEEFKKDIKDSEESFEEMMEEVFLKIKQNGQIQ